MNIFVIDENFNSLYIVDSFISFIWTDRYGKYGDFEIQLAATTKNFEIFKQNRYIEIQESDSLMIIESLQLKCDSERGDLLVISGRSLSSILDRRIVWGQITFAANKTIQEVVKKLLTDAFMTEGDRYVANFDFEDNPDLATSPVLDEDATSGYGVQYTGDNLYNAILGLCEEYQLGFKMGLKEDGKIVFKLYKGVDHSYSNTENNTYVIFSPEFENVLSSNYIESNKGLKNVVLVAGEGEGTDRSMIAVATQEVTGLRRREMFADAKDLSSQSYDEDGNEIQMSETEYAQILAKRGYEQLAENMSTVSFEGEVEAKRGFVYGTDFFLGDVVELVDRYGHQKKCRVVEMVVSYTTGSGYATYPTFELIKDEEVE